MTDSPAANEDDAGRDAGRMVSDVGRRQAGKKFPNREIA